MGPAFLFVAVFASFFSASGEISLSQHFTRARTVHGAIKQYSEWSHSEFGLEATEQRMRAEIAKGRLGEVCSALSRLTPEDLYYGSRLLLAKEKLAPCLEQEAERYREFLADRQAELLNKAQPYTLFKKGKRTTAGPSQEILIDPAETSVVFDGGVPEKTLVLTFDDGPHATLSEELLRILKAEDLQVNYFLVGRNTTLYPHIVRAQQADGHEVGCHSFTHADLRKLTRAKGIAEIEDGFTAIHKALGVPGAFFRFPYGAYTSQLRNYLISTNTTEFYWSIDTWDWKHKDPDFLLENSLKQVEKAGRGVILFHDIQPQTIAIMPAFLAELKNRDYSFAVMRPLSPRKLRDAH